MRKAALLTAVLLVLTSTMACAWIDYLDGTTLPSAPWEQYAEEGESVLVTAYDGSQAIRVNSWESVHEWYLNPTQPVTVGAARFSLVDFSATGQEDLLCVIADNLVEETLDGDMIFSSPSLSITLDNGNFWVYDYTDGIGLVDLGPASINQFHTAYIMIDGPAGTAKVSWDGNIVFNGPATAHDFDGYVEWGSGSWQCSADTCIDFDWVAYGGASDMVPEPGSFATLGVGLVGLLGAMRRRK